MMSIAGEGEVGHENGKVPLLSCKHNVAQWSLIAPVVQDSEF